MEYDEGTHRKRLAQILRYIASMHHSLDVEAAGCSFVQPVEGGGCSVDTVSDFFQYENYHNKDDTDRPGGVLCSTENFRRLLAMESSDSLQFASPPFSFYAASATQVAEHKHKRTLAGAIKNTLTAAASTTTRIAAAAADDSLPEKGCWLRITRRTSAAVSSSSSPPVVSHPDLRRYLDDWLAQTPQARSWESLLTKRRLEQAPKLPPTVSIHGGQAVKSFLRRYKKYLRRRSYQRKLEPIYNRLFEYVQNQQGNCDELVWGLGHAGMWIDDGDNKLVNGPILEVLVEVELARDGTLLVRPREHTGVALNREVIAALKADVTILQQLHRTVAELEPSHLSPGQPATYVPLLKRIAVQLSSGGSFQPASTAKALRDLSKLTVTEAWCLYSRPKPNSVWARDATAFADQLLKPPHQRGGTEFVLPKAAWSLTHGPGSLEQYHKAAFGHAAAIDQGVWHWISSKFLGKTNEISARKPLFPLPSSDAQNRIADLLLCRNYPAVVCEGPPGTGKTHSIANTICAYLCQGKRVLVTSKNASALSVLRNRLPVTVQELCVDVSMSESTGVRQLQLTVERLSNRLARGNCEMEQQKFLYLQVRRRTASIEIFALK